MELNELRKIAEAEESHKYGPWAVTEDDWDGFCVYSKDGKPGIAYVAKDMQQGESEGESTARHIATFSPPTVLALIARLEQVEQAVTRVREVAAGWATNDRPFREAILRALDGEPNE